MIIANLTAYRGAVAALMSLYASDRQYPKTEARLRKTLDNLWYQLTDEEKEQAPPIPFRSLCDAQ